MCLGPIKAGRFCDQLRLFVCLCEMDEFWMIKGNTWRLIHGGLNWRRNGPFLSTPPRVVFVGGGEAGELPPHWIWPSLPLVCLKTSLPGKGWFPVTAEILLNCSSYQSTLSKGLKQIVFNFDSCYASSASKLPNTAQFILLIYCSCCGFNLVRLLCSPVMQINLFPVFVC